MEYNNADKRIVIRDIHDPSDAKRLQYIQEVTWGTGDVVPFHVFIATATVGGVVKGAYVDGELVGYVYGFYGKFMGRLCHYSHQLAVLPDYQNLNIGYMLKMAQRQHCLDEGLDLVVWTYDPLQSKNAYLNINKLGTVVKTYFINHYGEMDDELNRGLASDRFMVEWWIDSKWVRNRESSRIKFFEDYSLADKVDIALEAVREGDVLKPVEKKASKTIVGIEIPSDINVIKRIDMRIARKWRVKTRILFREYFSKGYTVYRYLRFKQDGSKGIYLLTRGFDPNDYGEI